MNIPSGFGSFVRMRGVSLAVQSPDDGEELDLVFLSCYETNHTAPIRVCADEVEVGYPFEDESAVDSESVQQYDGSRIQPSTASPNPILVSEGRSQ